MPKTDEQVDAITHDMNPTASARAQVNPPNTQSDSAAIKTTEHTEHRRPSCVAPTDALVLRIQHSRPTGSECTGLSPTCSVPAEGHGVGGGPGGDPQRENTDHDAAKVREEMSGVRHDGQALRRVTAWRRKGYFLESLHWTPQ